MSKWIPNSIRFPKNSFLMVRRTIPTSFDKSNSTFKTDDKAPFSLDKVDYTEKETKLIHTEEFTWAVNNNSFYTMEVLMTWMSPDKKWHATLMQKKPILFKCPMITPSDILFSEREMKKVGTYKNVSWIQSEKGFRYVINNSSQLNDLIKLLH